MLGHSAANLIGKPVWERCVEGQREECRRSVLGKLAGQIPVEPVERQYGRGNGDRITVCVYESLIRDARGEVTGLRAAVLDTTPIHRTERALAASEGRFRNLFEKAPVGIYRTSVDGRMLQANPTLIRMLGYASFEELAARDFERETIHPSYDRAAFRRELERDGEIHGREVLWLTRSGRPIAVRESARVIRDAEDGVVYYEGVVEDITERKRARERLMESEERYRDLFEKAQDVIFSIDLHGRIRSMNRAGELLSGYTRQELLKMTMADLMGGRMGFTSEPGRGSTFWAVIPLPAAECASDQPPMGNPARSAALRRQRWRRATCTSGGRQRGKHLARWL